MNDLLLRALRGERVERPPVWFMRQAGRYLPEYRQVRAQAGSFLSLCRNAELATEVTRQPVDRFGLDAAIVFSDILVVLGAMGAEVTFEAGEGPRITSPVRTRSAADALTHPDVEATLPHAPEVIRRFREMRPDVPILGFAGAPFTLLCYLVEGHGDSDWVATKTFLWSDPVGAKQLLDRIADVVGDFLNLQVESGAAAVQLFDTWAGTLAPEDWRRFALPAAERALSRVRGAPRIYYTRDASPFLPWLVEIGADAWSLDWRVDLRAARRLLPGRVIQGNLDPVVLFAPEDEVRKRVRGVISAAGHQGHVFNLGHGILPNTPISAVEAMIDEAKRPYAEVTAG